MCLGAILFDTDWQGVVLLWVLPQTPPWEGHSLVTTNPDDDRVSTDTSISDKPPPPQEVWE